jgi:hypothetical protein
MRTEIVTKVVNGVTVYSVYIHYGWVKRLILGYPSKFVDCFPNYAAALGCAKSLNLPII